jgi:hypothetical protein
MPLLVEEGYMRMDIVLIIVLALFGIGAGFFIGCGNYGGALGAILPGVIAGALLAIPMLRDRQFAAAAVIVACSLVGSLIASQVGDSNGVKTYLRNQKNLTIRAGSYRLGTGDLDGDKDAR